ncbi:class I SAM-dependent methyltransferase [Yaniella flava]|uniref:Class I SAM-dependent methyltransferase n=1 Tax=Yaniella flava TaxID=287930 RepID=A0ABN2U728_9MICC
MNEIPMYGDVVSSFYDLLYPPIDVPQVVEYVQQIHPNGCKIVDFGVGTGRTAIPLALVGNDVLGIDISQRMIDTLHDKDPESSVRTEVKSFVEATGDESFDLCMIMNNTFFMVMKEEERGQTLHSASSFLKSGGYLIIENYAAHHYLRADNTLFTTTPLGKGDLVLLDQIEVDPIEQRLVALRSIVGHGNVSTFVEVSRFSLPQDVDGLAAQAGFKLVARMKDWEGGEVDVTARSHISVYEKCTD